MNECWICLQPVCDSDSFKCCMVTHRTCLVKWQVRCIGKSDEFNCRLCQAALPDWVPDIKEHMSSYVNLSVHLRGKVHTVQINTQKLQPCTMFYDFVAMLPGGLQCLNGQNLTIRIMLHGSSIVTTIDINDRCALNKLIWLSAYARGSRQKLSSLQGRLYSIA